MTIRNLDRLLEPASVAFIGASPVPPASITRSRPGLGGSVRSVPTGAPARRTSPGWVLCTMAVLTGPPPTRRTWRSNPPSGPGNDAGV